MDYRGREHLLPILYTLRLLKGIRCYLPYYIIRAIDIGIDVPPICRLVKSTLDTLTAKGVLRLIVWFLYRQRVAIKKAGFGDVGLFREEHGDTD